MTQDPSLAQALSDAFEARLLDLHVSTVCRVTAYDAATQRVSVQGVNQRAYIDEAGDRQVENLPVFQDVPVGFCGTASDNMTWPIAVGDTCQVVFSEQSIAAWLRRGGGPIDPQDDRKHSLSDGIAWFGVRDFSHPIANVPTNAVVITAKNQLRLGGYAASQAVVVQSALGDFMTALQNAINTATAVSPQTAVTIAAIATLGYLKAALLALNTGGGWEANTTIAKAL